MKRKISLLVLFLVMISVSSLGALYNEKFRWHFTDKHQLMFAGANDADGFKFTDFYDDLRTASLFFVYLAPKEIPFFVEFSANMHTYRGHIHSPDSARRRVDQADLFLSYYWFFPFAEGHKIKLSAGGRFSVFGNLGGVFAQDAFHWLITQRRPIVTTGWDPYRFIGYATGKVEYSWQDWLFINADLQVSPLGDFFVRGGAGLELRNDFLSVEASLYVQQSHYQNLAKESSLWWTTQSENGFGLFYRLQTEHYFIFRDIVLANWSPDREGGQFFSVGGQGFIISLDGPKDPKKEGKGETNSPKLLSPSVGMRFTFNLPFQYSHSLLWVPRPNLPFTLSVGLSSNVVYRNILSNRLFANFLWDFFQISFFGLFLETGASVSFDWWQAKGLNDSVFRPVYSDRGLSLNLQANLGMWFRLWHNESYEYRLALFTGISYAPLSVRYEFPPKSSTQAKLDSTIWSPNFFGLAVEVRPFQADLVKGKA